MKYFDLAKRLFKKKKYIYIIIYKLGFKVDNQCDYLFLIKKIVNKFIVNKTS